ncbi:hypothetical protein [Phycicoccus flavus]|uniref:hypothetical protein n=1 Tax=Phycicoccus flavus TaxID=2502783 RepID=UPI000FEBB740|nr:hypothetical protein [Phycicoccus flavus]NHA68221.1 hypothetical protein [Phycicoccus flavus]
MSVAAQLGLEGPETELLQTAQQQWPRWEALYPALAPAPALAGLRAWMQSLDVEPRNDVVCALGRLGSRDGLDEVPAAATLAWALVPGAITIARALQHATPVVDELVAAQLWLEVRTLPSSARHKVAANLLARVRVAVRRDLGLTAPRDPTWARSMLVDPLDPDWHRFPAPAQTAPPPGQAAAILQVAVAERVISDTDRDLLVRLAEESRENDATRSRAGLVTRRAGLAVAAETCLSDRQVRRRAARALDALAGAYAQQVPA